MPRKWLGIVIHHTAGHQTDTVESVRKQHLAMGWRDIGYHYFIEIDNKGRSGLTRGHLKHGRSTELPGCHGNAKANSTMLGFCCAGNYSETVLNGKIYEDVLGAVLHVMKMHNIPASMIFGHREIKATACPGKLFPLSALKADVKDRLEDE